VAAGQAPVMRLHLHHPASTPSGDFIMADLPQYQKLSFCEQSIGLTNSSQHSEFPPQPAVLPVNRVTFTVRRSVQYVAQCSSSLLNFTDIFHTSSTSQITPVRAQHSMLLLRWLLRAQRLWLELCPTVPL
jgi:hypothetical protein